MKTKTNVLYLLHICWASFSSLKQKTRWRCEQTWEAKGKRSCVQKNHLSSSAITLLRMAPAETDFNYFKYCKNYFHGLWPWRYLARKILGEEAAGGRFKHTLAIQGIPTCLMLLQFCSVLEEHLCDFMWCWSWPEQRIPTDNAGIGAFISMMSEFPRERTVWRSFHHQAVRVTNSFTNSK